MPKIDTGTKNQKLITNNLIALGLLLAFVVTTINLDRDSLALDEAWTMWAVRGDTLSDTLRRVNGDVHPPLYFFLVDGWVELAGESVFAVRMLSVYGVLIALAGTYAAGKRLFDTRTGLIALIYLSTAGYVVYYAREARMYTLLMAFSALATWAYWRWREKPSRTHAVIYAALLAGLIYTHYQGAWIMLAHGVHAVLTPPKLGTAPTPIRKRVSWFGVLALVGIFFAPWLPTMITQIHDHPPMRFGARATTWEEIRWLFYLLTDLYWPLLLVPFVGMYVFPRLADRALGRGVWRYAPTSGRSKQRPYEIKRETIILLLLWIVLPPIIILSINAWIRPSYQPRYVITVMPGIALVVACAIRQMRGRWLAVGMIVVLTVSHLAVYDELWPTKAPWEAAVRRVVANRQPDDPLIVLIDDHSIAAYYDRQLGLRRGQVIDLLRQDSFDLRALDSAPSIWVVMTLNAPVTWDVALTLDQTRHVGARDAISGVGGIDNTIFYRFDTEKNAEATEKNAGDTDDLRFGFGDDLVFDGETGRAWETMAGERICFDLPLHTLRDIGGQYSAGLHLLDRERMIAAQVDASLGMHAAGETFTFAACVMASAEPGIYTPILVIYDWATVENLPVYEGPLDQRFVWGEWLVLGMLTVTVKGE